MEHYEESTYDWNLDGTYVESLTDREKSWIKYFHQLAQVVATKSKDESTQIGAVLVNRDNSIVSTGYNSFPRGIKDLIPERQERPEKYYWMEHAERNAIYNAARNGVSTVGTRLFMSCPMPCPDCARGIINAGITELWIDRDGGAKGEHWAEGYLRSEAMLKEADVEVYYYDEL